VIICLAPGAITLSIARAIRRHLKPHHLYVDATTSSVKDMEKLAALLEGRAQFVDAAIMDPVPLGGIKVLTVTSGAHAETFRALLTPYGMNISVIGDKAGVATAFKLMRSVAMKGFAAVLLESLEAAQRFGVGDALAADIARYFDERPCEQIIKRWVCGTAIHAGRRVHEMGECMALLKALGSATRMTRATRENLKEMEAMGLRERFNVGAPETIQPVLDALIAARSSQSGRSPRSA
jgi:3-hydroxyisobutyrate dehydrogenase-like beta-hydroxyacid dehydrogenase